VRMTHRSPSRPPRSLSLAWLTAAAALAGCGGGDTAEQNLASSGARAQALQAGGTGTVTTVSWKRVADENQAFWVPANSTVRYGANGKYVKKTVSGNAYCTTQFFGSDPAPGLPKSCEVLITSSAPAPAPAPAPSPAPIPPNTYFFSDCQQGAAAGCVPGNNANAGTTPATAKRTLEGFNVNTLPAGARLLFARGGAWTQFRIAPLENPQATREQPLSFDAYGSGPAPWLKTASGTAFEFGRWQSQINDGGYVLRNLKLDGLGTGTWGLWLRDNVHDVLIENVEITGFELGIHAQSGAPHGVRRVRLSQSRLVANRDMGILGHLEDSAIENSSFERNNFSGSVFSHAIYLSYGSNLVIRGNRFLHNSVVNGQCTGGNVTFHGVMDNVLVENNRIEQVVSTPGCYGFSITAGYDAPESFTRVVLRNNTVINLGNCSFCINAAPGVVVEGNTTIVERDQYHAAVNIGGRPDPGDAADTGAIVRNNRACYPANGAYQFGETVASPGGEVGGNLVFRGTDANAENCPR
jgi:hypothetical protein